jgi:hypothetical protein
MLVTPKNGTACLTFALVVVSVVTIISFAELPQLSRAFFIEALKREGGTAGPVTYEKVA